MGSGRYIDDQKSTVLGRRPERQLFSMVDLYNVNFRNTDVSNVECRNIDVQNFTVKVRSNVLERRPPDTFDHSVVDIVTQSTMPSRPSAFDLMGISAARST